MCQGRDKISLRSMQVFIVVVTKLFNVWPNMQNKNLLECLQILAELMHKQNNQRLKTCM